MNRDKEEDNTSYNKQEQNGGNDIFISQPNGETNTQVSRSSSPASTFKQRKSQAFSRQCKAKCQRVLQLYCSHKVGVVTTQHLIPIIFGTCLDFDRNIAMMNESHQLM
jgi:hypothetical protein